MAMQVNYEAFMEHGDSSKIVFVINSALPVDKM